MPNVMAVKPTIGDALCESSVPVIPFLAPRRIVSQTTTAGVRCSNATNVGKRKTSTYHEFWTWQNSIWGQEPPKMHIHCLKKTSHLYNLL